MRMSWVYPDVAGLEYRHDRVWITAGRATGPKYYGAPGVNGLCKIDLQK